MCQTGSDREKLRILAIVAHPHDFTHCAGTCGIHVKLGDDVTVVTLMSGEKMHNEKYYSEMMKPASERDPAVVNMTAEEYGKIKENEFRQAVSVFGVEDIRILHAPEPYRYFSAPEYSNIISDIILELRPDIIIMQSPYIDGNLVGRNNMSSIMLDDHSQTAVAVHEAIYLAEAPDYATKKVPHIIASVLYLGIYFNRDQVDFYIDVTDFAEQRVAAESMFVSQGHNDDYARRRIETTVGSLGYWSRTAYAEAYVRAKYEVYEEIPVPPVSIRRAREDRLAYVRRIEGKKE